MQYSHLHCHTQYSLLDGAAKISAMFKKAAADKMPAIAITDHGNMFGVFEFVAEASKHNGVKPIVGCEFYMVEDRHKRAFTKDQKDKRFHQLFLAKNAEGYANLTKMCSLGYIEGLYGKYPRIDKELILKYHKGLIATTCCLGAEVPQAILMHGEAVAREKFKWWLDLFGEDYYVELQRHKIPDQIKVNEVLLRFAKEFDVKVIASNDSHYVDRADSNAHDILLCLNTGEKQATPKMDDFDDGASQRGKRFAFYNDEFYFKTTAEMGKIFPDLPQALDNTNEIVAKIEPLKLKRDILLPNFVIPEGFVSQDEYLTHLTFEGAKERYKELTPQIEERLNFELFTVRTMGFAGYFLIVADFIKAGRDLGVFIGPGRGCIKGNSNIILQNGRTKHIEDIKIGDKVWTQDGSLQTVTNRFEYPVDETLLNIKNYYGEAEGVTMTKDHKVLAEKQQMPKNWDNWSESTRLARKKPDPTGNLTWMPACDLAVGDWVFIPTPNFNFKKAIPTSYNIAVRRFEEDNVEYKSSKVQTPKHPIIDFAQFSNGLELKHDNLTVTHDVLNVLAKTTQKTKTIPRYLELDDDWFKIFGFFAGDGWFRKEYRPEVSFVFNLKDEDWIIFFKNKMRNCGFEFSEQLSKKVVQIHVQNKHLYLLFKKIFHGYQAEAHSKHVPDIVINGNESQILNFLKGYCFADGHESQSKIKFTTVSRNLADQVRFICCRVGIPANLSTDKRIGDKREMFKNRTLAYMVSIPKDARIGNYDAQDLYVYRKVEGGILTKIRSITEVTDVKKVYDIEVENNHNYLTSSFLVHNSAAGSAIAYCIGITNIDPIKYNLLFERFLNPDRKSMPDIDTDFDDEGRQKVIDYVVKKYGKQQVAQITTYGTMAAKMSIKDVARVLDLPLQEANAMVKLVSDKPGIKLNRLLTAPIYGEGSLSEKENLIPEDIENAKALREILEGDDDRAKVLKEALILEGSVRGTGIHAAGIIIAPKDLTDIIPVYASKETDLLITQFEGSIIEDAGVIKMDFLGLKTLSIMRDALKLIKENYGITLDIDEIPLDDKKTYQLYQRGETNATFQFESPGMQKHLRDLKPDKFADLIAMNALYRPGPLQYIPNFINRKHGREKVVYDLDAMEEYLHETYGICVTGDTLIYNPKTGERARMDSLESRVGEYYVQGVDNQLNAQIAPITHWVCNGKKAIVKVKLNNGSIVKMTPDHRVLTETGWQEIGKLKVGDSIATMKSENAPSLSVIWDFIEIIAPIEAELVYDITVAEIHNFLGNNIILHNCVYQEQIMLLSQKLANFSKGDADVLRKAMGKKQIAVLDKMKPKFLAGCEKNGHALDTCEKVWADWQAFAAYAFNKSHSTCYAFVAFQTGYLKAHYPGEYMAAVLTHGQGNLEKITFFMEECRSMGIAVKSPDVNESDVTFTVNKKGEIRYALTAAKGVGEAAVAALIEERKQNGIYKDVFDFVTRSNSRTINKKVIESLVYAGAMDGFGLTRATYFSKPDGTTTFIEMLIKYGNAYQSQKDEAKVSLFGGGSNAIMTAPPAIPKVEEWNLIEKLNFEKEVVGIFLSGHPLDDFRMQVKVLEKYSLDKLEFFKNQKVKIAAFVTAVNERISKKGTPWGAITIQDYRSSAEFTLFNDDYARHGPILKQGNSVYIEAEYKTRYNSTEYELKITSVKLLESVSVDNLVNNVTIVIPLERITSDFIETMTLFCDKFKGKNKLRIQIQDSTNHLFLKLYSLDKNIKIDTNLLRYMDSEGWQYSLN
jgi:DNA polymerase III alpha subunit/intein/homing endonuclease